MLVKGAQLYFLIIAPSDWYLPDAKYCVTNSERNRSNHDDVIKWKHFPRYWPFVQGIHRWPVNSLHEGQWRRALIFSLICAWINGWVNNHEAGDLRSHLAHYDVTVMSLVESTHWNDYIDVTLLNLYRQQITWKNYETSPSHLQHFTLMENTHIFRSRVNHGVLIIGEKWSCLTARHSNYFTWPREF